MRTTPISFSVCLAVAVTAGNASTGRAQTLYGPGGLFIHPTAYTPPAQSITANASIFTQDIAGKPASQWVPLGLSYGITNRLEIGAMYVDRLGSDGLDRGSAGLFARDQIVPEKGRSPAIALSGSYLESDVKLASVAASAGYHFRSAGRTVLIGHAGIQWGWRGDGVPPSDSVSTFFGGEVPIRYGLSVLGEYGTRFSFDYKESSAIGLMWHSRHGFSVAAGYVNVGRSSSNRFFVGVGVPIGGNK